MVWWLSLVAPCSGPGCGEDCNNNAQSVREEPNETQSLKVPLGTIMVRYPHRLAPESVSAYVCPLGWVAA
jgi:hypothetical protein